MPAVRRTKDNSFSPGEQRAATRNIDVDMNDFDATYDYGTEQNIGDPEPPQASLKTISTT